MLWQEIKWNPQENITLAFRYPTQTITGDNFRIWKPSVAFRVKIPPCCWMLRNKGGIFTKYPRSQIPNFFLACGGLQKLVFVTFTFCSPPQAENFDISRFQNTILPSKIDVLLPKYQNFRLPAEPLRQISRCCETRGGIFTKGGNFYSKYHWYKFPIDFGSDTCTHIN